MRLSLAYSVLTLLSLYAAHTSAQAPSPASSSPQRDLTPPPAFAASWPTPPSPGPGANPTGASGVFSLSTALAAAIRSHPQMLNAQANIRAAGYGGEAARWGHWPGAQLQSHFGDRYKDSVLLVDQPVWNGGRTQAQINAADARTQVAGATASQTVQDLAERTADAYLQWTAALDRVGLHQKYVAELERLRGVIERRASASVASTADVQQAQVRWEQAHAAKLAAEGAVMNARFSLENLTLVGVGLSAAQPQWPSFTDLDSQTAWQQAEAEHPSLAVLRNEREAVKHESEAKQAALWPQVGLRYRKPLTRNEEIAGVPNWQLTIQAQSDGALVTQSNWKGDAERLIALEQREAATRLQLNTLLRQAAQDESTGRRQHLASQNAAETALTVVASAVRQFEVGRRSWLDVLNAVREAHEAQLTALNARLLQYQAAARLHAMAQNLPGLMEANRAATALAKNPLPAASSAPSATPSTMTDTEAGQ